MRRQERPQQQTPNPFRVYHDHSDPFNQLQYSTKTDLRIAEIDKLFRNVAFCAIIVYILLVILSYLIGFRMDRIERLSGVEQQAPFAAAILLGTSILSSLIPMIYRMKKGEHFTGVITAGFIVQSVAFLTNVLLCTIPVPVFLDPITGARVFLLRWSEWTPLAFVMTFMTEVCHVDNTITVIESDQVNDFNDLGKVRCNENATNTFTRTGDSGYEKISLLPSPGHSHHNLVKRNVKTRNIEGGDNINNSSQKNQNNSGSNVDYYSAFSLALCQGLSTFCGWLFPFMTNSTLWVITMLISCLLFVTIYYRLCRKYNSFRKMKAGSSLSEQEIHLWARLSLGLLATCAALWTLLVFSFLLYSFGPLLLPKHHLLNKEGIVMVCESSIDVLFKSIYLVIIVDVHRAIFDPNARANRRLEELRKMMNIVWAHSSDVIALSVRKPTGDTVTLFSPTFLKLYSESGRDGFFSLEEHQKHPNSSVGAALELDAKYFTSQRDMKGLHENSSKDLSSVYEIEFGSKHFSTDGDLLGNVTPTMSKRDAPVDKVQPVAELVFKAWQSHAEPQSILHDLVCSRNAIIESITCEANITRLEDNMLVVVIRNVSDRFRRFEAEKKAVSETTARIKDAAANRFTRHEVMNGLLAAIGLCDSLKESLSKSGYINDDSDDHGKIILKEMDKTLHETLDTVLFETMARDVIHEVYEPKLERTDIVQLIQNTIKKTSTSLSSDRFLLRTEPSTIPEILIDPLLLKYIHRNAISNACKYGERGGKVLTEIKWETQNGLLRIDVINSPGNNHDEIIKLGVNASDIVFSPSKRLPMHVVNSATSLSHSSGDGAWVMLKCAKTLGGDCDIKFLEDKTVFTFQCTISPSCDISSNNCSDEKEFKLPLNLHAIALDDSKIQRKLLVRYFKYAGLSEGQVTILGGRVREITDFVNSTCTFIENHPNDFILLVVDENLDVYEDLITPEATISGSTLVSNIRHKLLPDDERRMLALIRSANDSADDVAIYNSRAHGYLPKAPVKPGKVLEELAPHWLSRFPSALSKLTYVTSDRTVSRVQHNEEEFAMTKNYLKECITFISELMLSKDDVMKNWLMISEKLHLLRGDLLTMSNNDPRLSIAVDMINDMRDSKVPHDVREKWEIVRSIIFGGL